MMLMLGSLVLGPWPLAWTRASDTHRKVHSYRPTPPVPQNPLLISIEPLSKQDPRPGGTQIIMWCVWFLLRLTSRDKTILVLDKAIGGGVCVKLFSFFRQPDQWLIVFAAIEI